MAVLLGVIALAAVVGPGARPVSASTARPSESVGRPVLAVRPIVWGGEEDGIDRGQDDLPTWFVSADGWLFVHGSGWPTGDAAGTGPPAARLLPTAALPGTAPVLPALTAYRIGTSGIAALRRVVETAGLATFSADPGGVDARPPATRAAYEFGYRSASGQYVLRRKLAADAAIAPLLRALARPSTLARSPVHRSYEPVRLRLRAEYVEDPVGASPPGWGMRAVPLATVGSCASADGARAKTLLAKMRARRRADVTVTVGGTARAEWSNYGARYVVAVRPLLPGEQRCPLPRP